MHTPDLTHGLNRPRVLNFFVRLIMVALVLGPSTGTELDICVHGVVNTTRFEKPRGNGLRIYH